MEIKFLNQEEILQIWRTKLWPDRQTPIELVSSMVFLGGYDTAKGDPVFIGFKENSTIIGCNSLHLCSDGSARSRGLYVLPKFRNAGLGSKLLVETIRISKQLGANHCWSFPRAEALKVYCKSGFYVRSNAIFDELENKTNYYVSTIGEN